ncbi:MAG TPA: hypothetical protein DIT89_07210, partial [Planctomycetaceae bacterium]|nr:hypothetical protein [Planctomycetaceae bacterium]
YSRQRKVAHRVMTSQTLKMQVIQPVLTETSNCRAPAVDFRNDFHGRIVDFFVHIGFRFANQGDFIEAVSLMVVSFRGCVTSPDTVILDFC